MKQLSPYLVSSSDKQEPCELNNEHDFETLLQAESYLSNEIASH